MYFDEPYYQQINEARWATADRIIDGLPGIRTCLDAGCGPGWFADKLSRRGLTVVGVDGRAELIEIAQRRVPNALFCIADVTDPAAMKSLPQADLVFCFGLLYHLENSFSAIRILYQLTRRYLLIETQLTPETGPVFRLVSEGQNETQGLHFLAVIPSREALVKMLYSAGFGSVERYTGRTEHPDFIDQPDRVHRREIFLASSEPIRLPDFVVESEPSSPKINYCRPSDG